MNRQRHILIFGATGGIGSALSRRLAESGARLALASRGGARLAQLAEELQADPLTVDATDCEAVDQTVDGLVERWGRLDGVVNCVGSLLLKPAHRTTPQEWNETLALNLTSAFAVLRAGARVMKKEGGAIVLLSSAAAQIGLGNHEAIAAAKAGVVGLCRAAAASYSRSGIRVNCVAPGLVRTPLTSGITSNEIALKASKSLHALGRIGEPAEIASAIDWLLHPDQSWITGQVIGVDGGLAGIKNR